jgi:hypothetical protein
MLTRHNRRYTVLEELDEVIARQMSCYNYERRHSRLAYRSPWSCLRSEGFIFQALVETGGRSGSA